MIPFILLLALIWGAIWASFLQFVPLGRFLAIRRTWLTVVVGVGVDLLIALAIVPWPYWWPLAAVVALSALPIIARSIINEYRENQDQIDAIQDAAR
jgi:hypothetical protein